MKDTPAIEKRALSLREFAAGYSIGLTSVYQEIKAGRLATVKVGARRLITVDAAERWLAALATGEESA